MTKGIFTAAVISAVLLTGPTNLYAKSCETLVDDHAANIRAAENHLANGEYDAFISIIDEQSTLTPETKAEMRKALYADFPNGFAKCRHLLYEEVSTVMSRRGVEFIDSNGLSLYVFLLSTESSTGVPDTRDILKVLVTSDFGQLYDEWN